MLFSATKTQKTESLTRLALKNELVYVGVDDDKDQAIVEGLTQEYILCHSEKRLLTLITLLKKFRRKKMMVFFSSCRSVMFHHVFFNIISLPNMSIHGRQAQTKRTKTFYDFCSASSGTLLCTDVAARDLDIPNVDCIIQYDPPSETKEYIHRVGRTARGVGSCGNALLILRPEELEFLKYLEKAKVPVTELELKNTVKAQLQIEKLMSKTVWLRDSAKDAYESYLRAYNSHNLKDVFNVNTLNLAEVVKSIGFLVPPTNFPFITRSSGGNTSRSRKERVHKYSKDRPNAARRYQRANKYRKF